VGIVLSSLFLGTRPLPALLVHGRFSGFFFFFFGGVNRTNTFQASGRFLQSAKIFLWGGGRGDRKITVWVQEVARQ